jgi:hypothetical protein
MKLCVMALSHVKLIMMTFNIYACVTKHSVMIFSIKKLSIVKFGIKKLSMPLSITLC